jgi:hypothetical protein
MEGSEGALPLGASCACPAPLQPFNAKANSDRTIMSLVVENSEIFFI